MISWEPIAMRSGDRLDRAMVDTVPVPGEAFVRKRRIGRELFALDGLDLPTNTPESAALAQYRAAHPQAQAKGLSK